MVTNKLIIDRSKHRRSGMRLSAIEGATQLLNEKGYMCCLGFCARQNFGIEEQNILSVTKPSDIKLQATEFCNLQGIDELIAANDDICLTDSEREARLIELFAKIGIECSFVGGYQHPIQ